MQEYSKKFIDNLLQLLTSLKGIIILLIGQMMAFPGVKTGTITLLIVFSVDFITGLCAGWIERKPDGSPYFLESRKLRRTLLKAITYLVFIGIMGLFYYMFFDAPIDLPLSTKSFTVIEIAFGICIAIECWSILENFKRMGFDLIGKITNTAKKVWKLINTVKTGNE